MFNYSIEGEFTKVLATEEWRISRVNQNYTVCSSYGKAVIVPKSIDDSTLTVAATFRQGGRFPVLSYRHSNGVRFVQSLLARKRKTWPLTSISTLHTIL